MYVFGLICILFIFASKYNIYLECILVHMYDYDYLNLYINIYIHGKIYAYVINSYTNTSTKL